MTTSKKSVTVSTQCRVSGGIVKGSATIFRRNYVIPVPLFFITECRETRSGSRMWPQIYYYVKKVYHACEIPNGRTANDLAILKLR